jgi:hypothetical protein
MSTDIPVLPDVRVASVMMRLQSDPMRHHMEDGSLFIDTRVPRPNIMTIQIFCPNLDAVNQVNAVMANRHSLYTIKSRGLSFRSMKLNSMAPEQTPKVLSATPMTLEFRQIIVQNVAPVLFRQASDSKLVDRGISLIEDAKESVLGVVDSVNKAVGQATERATNFIGNI